MFTTDELATLTAAAAILDAKCRLSPAISSPDLVKGLCINRLAAKEHEVFAVLMLDSQHRLIEFVELFRGTINSASVYPREVAKEVLSYNASAVIFSHNHPSGVAEPSQADRRITERLVSALGLLDVQVLDHIVVGLNNSVSFAERGLL
jgi:DNA repair protein RadC